IVLRTPNFRADMRLRFPGSGRCCKRVWVVEAKGSVRQNKPNPPLQRRAMKTGGTMSRRDGMLLAGLLVMVMAPTRSLAQVGDVFGTTDPAIAHLGDTYYLFSTGFGVPIRTSHDLITWRRDGRVLDALPNWVFD